VILDLFFFWQSHNKKASAMCYGPDENSRVANYKMVLERFPLSLTKKKWSDKERENLSKGIKQQFQETLLQISVDRMR
jgi:transcription factor MYB, plant